MDAPLVNAGVFYANNLSRADGGAWVLRELSRRIHLFLWHPEAVVRYVPWAVPPFYANADEQTLMNDVIVSSISGKRVKRVGSEPTHLKARKSLSTRQAAAQLCPL